MNHVELLPEVKEFLAQSPIPAFINGQWQTTGEDMPVIDPATGEAITSVSAAQGSDVDQAIGAAHAAFPAWSALSVDERAKILVRFAEKIDESAEALAQLETLDVGKPIENARGFDVPFGTQAIRYFANLSQKAEYDIPLDVADMDARIHRAPYGVCGFIFPWNFPYLLFCWGCAPALAAGNTVVVKASEVTPLSTLYIGKIAEEAGIPAGVINIYTGDGRECGQPLAEHPLVKRMSFTGSSSVGKLIGKICGENLTPCKLELGGKGAAVVLPDADVAAAAEGLAGAITLNTGQVCCTATRWFVHDSIYDEFVEKVTGFLNQTPIGHGLSESVVMGPLVSKAQLDRVTDYYHKGIAEGAEAIVKMETPASHADSKGYFISPHLLSGTEDNICYKEEVFGPTAYLVKYSDVDAAITSVNKLSYGLANSVWSTDLKKAASVSEKVIAGNSWINAHNVFAYGLPYGGVNYSGTGGGVNSQETFDDYLRNQTIARPL